MFKRLLHHNDDWELFGKFIKRAGDFIDLYTPTAPKDAILDDMTKKWVNFPRLTGYFLALDELDRPYAHVACWISSNYGQNRLFGYQAEADRNAGNFADVWPLITSWIQELNVGVAPALQVQKVELTTWHSEEFWKRYLQRGGLQAVKVRSIIEADIFPEETEQPPPSATVDPTCLTVPDMLK